MLAGGGPADVVELTLALAREMLAGAGRDDVDPADKLADGSAMDVWKAMIRAQDGDPDAALPDGAGVARRRGPVLRRAHPARRAGRRPRRLAARCRPGPQGGPGAGRCRRRLARPARATPSPRASRCFTLLTDDEHRFERALAALDGGYDIGGTYDAAPLVIDRIS